MSFVATHFEKNTHTEIKIKKSVKFGNNPMHFEKQIQSALRLYINITFNV